MFIVFFFFKQKTAYEMRISDWSSDVCSSDLGAETLACSTCHMTSTAPNTVPHAPPHVGLPWQLAPVKMEWFGKTSPQICAQLKDPARNGGRDGNGIVEHLIHDADVDGLIPWAWAPGGGRAKIGRAHVRTPVTNAHLVSH